jgi:hypothetical protein
MFLHFDIIGQLIQLNLFEANNKKLVLQNSYLIVKDR